MTTRAIPLTAPAAPEAPLWQSAAVMALLLVPLSAALLIDGRTLGPESVWAKPAKFALSFALHFATLAAVTARLSPSWRSGRLVRWMVVVSVASLIAEMPYITLQAAIGQPSHYFISDPFHAFMFFGVMATGALGLVVGSGGIGLAVWRDRTADLGAGTRLGAGIGLLIGSILTLLIASILSVNLSHQVGASATGTLPVTGWVTGAGDLRVPHFFANHMMQVLPLTGLLLDRLLTPRAARAGVVGVGVAWGALCLALLAQALLGLPLLPLR